MITRAGASKNLVLINAPYPAAGIGVGVGVGVTTGFGVITTLLFAAMLRRSL